MSHALRIPLLILAGLTALPAAAQGPDGDRPGAPKVEEAIPRRFGQRAPDEAFGAYQRGLYVTARNLAEPRAELGDAAAQVLIAEIYSRGLGVKRDEAEAAKWYSRAAERGVTEAQFQYAMMLLDGRGVKRDQKQAFALMEEAANSGNRLAQFNLAQMILSGDAEPTPEAVNRAVGYFEKAADQRLADAEYAMAEVYANGLGGRTKNESIARNFLERAAKQNYDTAQLEYASWLIAGRGGERESAAGFAWMKRAAEGGNVAARNRLAKLYVAGIGVEGDPVLGAAWYLRAQRAGLRDPEMDDHLAGLTEAQLKAAEDQADKLR
ncbi:sel1 repeat family protein [Tianweitania sp. BSSL-BM11]|uniref:Sel1 repeat family protein n=1 Tax=Tianweitania aestuarii TaxID=2814886 RepID=A0ABS5RZU8_9HYPH|nr:tetratricopeptide repeat protein [Tianweitania aestuarii]MBS9722580.1 sel1 repeat family protein [Tianweitania aestuarii]